MNPQNYNLKPNLKTVFILLILFPSLLVSQTYFEKVMVSPIVTTLNYNNISAWGDYDNDHDQDVVISSFNDNCETCTQPILFFENNGDGTFTRITNNTIAQTMVIGSGLAWGDYDNDSYLDLFVCGTVNSRNKLFHNERNGNFSLVTNSIVVNDDVAWSQGCSWTDYNKDQWLDLFVTNRFRSNFLYKNNGDGTFTKITVGSIVNDIGSSRGCAWGDYDNDGWQDLFVANYEGLNDFMYHNNGNGTFTRVFNQPMLNDGLWGSGCAWFDYDNNGFLDLYVTGDVSKLYHNEGNGNFTLSNSILNQNGNRYGFSWGDYDNDGLTDIFVCNRNQINHLYKNNGGAIFTKMTNEIVGQEGLWSVSACMIDYDRNGKLDLLVTNRFSNLHNYLYKNTGVTGNYIGMRLRGCINEFGIGARIRVVAGDLVQIKEVTSGSGWGSDHSTWNHFGLGNHQVIDTIIIDWPSGIKMKFGDIAVNQTITVNECPGEIVSIQNGNSLNSNNIDLSYKLDQNFPNPFNPYTLIKYEIPNTGLVSLKVYDIHGREITELVNKEQSKGSYEIKFDGANFSSGIYFYKLKTENFEETRMMTLMK